MLPCGTYNTQYRQDIAIVRTKLQWGLLIGFLIFIYIFPPLLNNPTMLNFIMITSIYLIAVLGLYLLTGLCGQIHLGQSAFVAVGAYTTAILMSRFGLSFWLALPCSALTTIIIGLIFGIPSLKVKGFYLAIATLAAQFIITWIIIHTRPWTGGYDGIACPYATLGGIEFKSDRSFYFVVMAITILMVFFAKNIARTKTGKAFVAIRDNDLAAEVLGINVFHYKLLAFALCSAYAGIAGALYAPFIIKMTPVDFSLMRSVWFLAMLIVGGMGSVVGAIMGTVFLKALEDGTTVLAPIVGTAMTNIFPQLYGKGVTTSFGLLIFGLVVALFLIFEPRGLNHRWEIFKASYRLHPFPY